MIKQTFGQEHVIYLYYQTTVSLVLSDLEQQIIHSLLMYTDTTTSTETNEYVTNVQQMIQKMNSITYLYVLILKEYVKNASHVVYTLLDQATTSIIPYSIHMINQPS